MQSEKGLLPIGIEHGGARHRAFEMRPRKVKDSIGAAEDPRSLENDSFMGLAILSGQIISLGEIPPAEITADLLMELYEPDLAELYASARRLENHLRTFRASGEGAPEGGADAS